MAATDVAFVTRQLERLLNDISALGDDTTLIMSRLDRMDASTRAAVERMEIASRGVLDELRAMHGRHDRLAKAGRAPRRREPRCDPVDRRAFRSRTHGSPIAPAGAPTSAMTS